MATPTNYNTASTQRLTHPEERLTGENKRQDGGKLSELSERASGATPVKFTRATELGSWTKNKLQVFHQASAHLLVQPPCTTLLPPPGEREAQEAQEAQAERYSEWAAFPFEGYGRLRRNRRLRRRLRLKVYQDGKGDLTDASDARNPLQPWTHKQLLAWLIKLLNLGGGHVRFARAFCDTVFLVLRGTG